MLVCSRQEVYEHDMAARWFALPAGITLSLVDGSSVQVIYAGCAGSSAGPDICDAVLRFYDKGTARWSGEMAGDVELHVRASDWYAHGHHDDPRYNGVILHVVLTCDSAAPIRRQDSEVVPMYTLYDLPIGSLTHVEPLSRHTVAEWPCHEVMQRLSSEERDHVLRLAGLLRFEQKAHAFVERLHKAQPMGALDAYDVCLIEALAEGLGYGRNRAFFRAAGQYLMGLESVGSVPEPLGHTSAPSSLDAERLAFLRGFVERGKAEGVWGRCKHLLFSDEVLDKIRALFAELGMARADILHCNVVLPFAAAVALVEHDTRLWERAQQVYEEHPGLVSNRITRGMRQQLRLEGEPHGACRQQGLHFIYQQTCREKRCDMCMVGWRQL